MFILQIYLKQLIMIFSYLKKMTIAFVALNENLISKIKWTFFGMCQGNGRGKGVTIKL